MAIDLYTGNEEPGLPPQTHIPLRRDIEKADRYAAEAQARGDTHRYLEERAIGDALRGQLWHAEHPEAL